MNALFAVFAKPAVAGATKTRLAASVGNERAAALARAFFADVWGSVSTIGDRVLATTAAPDGLGLAERDRWWLQGDGDLGDRLERIFQRGLLESPVVVAFGADSPGIPLELLRELAWCPADGALVPADDGGFVGLALRRCPPGVFGGIPWSAPTAASATLANLRAAGLVIDVLAPWWDVDEVADLDRLRTWLQEDPSRAPRTWLALNS